MARAGRPIVVFDSGEGGLTLLKQAWALYPGEKYIYICDTAHFPYGQRPLAEVRTFFLGVLRYALTLAPKAVVIACNTATAAALDAAREASGGVPVVGVVEPGILAAVRATENRRIGVLTTVATHRSGIYERGLRAAEARAVVWQRPCPLLVVLAENGRVTGPESRAAVARCVEGLLAEGVDTVILGCTHFPHMQAIFAEVVGNRAHLIDPGLETAKILPRYVASLMREGSGSVSLFTTGDPERVARVGRQLWEHLVMQPEQLAWEDGEVVRRR